MSVAAWFRSVFTGQDPASYKSTIDGNFAVLERVGAMFAPQALATPNMTIQVRAGTILDNGTLVEIAAQTTTVITAPSGNPRIDRVVIDQRTGVYTIVTGTPAVSPAAPAIPAGKMPCAQILLQTTSTSIVNSMITDERCFASISNAALGTLYALLASPTFTGTPAAPTANPGTSTTQLATTQFVSAAISAAFFPSGTRMLFQQTAAPTGWTKDTNAALNDTALRIVTGTVGSGGSVAFSTAMATPGLGGSSASYALTINDIPAHSHGVSGGQTTATTSFGPYFSGTDISTAYAKTTNNAGGGAAHAHGAGSLTANINLKYNDVIIASKN